MKVTKKKLKPGTKVKTKGSKELGQALRAIGKASGGSGSGLRQDGMKVGETKKRTPVVVTMYATVLQKLDAKRGCRLLKVTPDGLVTFSYRRPGSKKHNVETVTRESLLQFGKASDGTSWVYRMHRQLVDKFDAVDVYRSSHGIHCDLGDGTETTLMPNADFEILNAG